MSDLYKMFGTDANAEKEGVWIQIGDDEDKSPRFKLARAGGANSKYARVFEATMKPHRRLLETGLLEEATARRLYAKIYAEAVVLDWSNVVLKGEAIPFSKDNVIKVLTTLPELLAYLREEANRVASFRDALTEDDSGNS